MDNKEKLERLQKAQVRLQDQIDELEDVKDDTPPADGVEPEGSDVILFTKESQERLNKMINDLDDVKTAIARLNQSKPIPETFLSKLFKTIDERYGIK